MPPLSFGDLSGRRAVITGASSGIGKAIALEFARAGAGVLIHCRASKIQAQQVCDECRAAGRTADVLACDFSSLEQLPAFVNRIWSTWSAPDIWVNNAGADLLTGADAKLDFAGKLQRLFDVDVRSTMILAREAGRRMCESAGGVIINIGWDQADRGMEGDSAELFAASKNAIMGFTRSLAVSLAPKVRVNCIAPGWIRTAWGAGASEIWQERVLRETPLRRWGTPDDIAWLARFLASDQAAYITGQVINANGGAIR
jgi:3-oxoacyl-[acyl-carrier protein] reductase